MAHRQTNYIHRPTDSQHSMYLALAWEEAAPASQSGSSKFGCCALSGVVPCSGFAIADTHTQTHTSEETLSFNHIHTHNEEQRFHGNWVFTEFTAHPLKIKPVLVVSRNNPLEAASYTVQQDSRVLLTTRPLCVTQPRSRQNTKQN